MLAENESLYKLDISTLFGKDYVSFFNDTSRLLIIQFAIQLMLVMSDPSNYQMFSADFLIILLFVLVGSMLYWLIFKKIVLFV